MTTKARATIDDLYKVAENAKAEIVNGEIILMSPTGAKPGRASFHIASNLHKNKSPKPKPPYLDGAWRLMICFHDPG